MKSKEVEQLIRVAEDQGWRTRRTKRGHVVFYAPDGEGTAGTGGTPSDHRSIKNFRAQLKRLGLKIPTK